MEKALRREVKEEVNVEIGKASYLMDLTFIRPDGIPVLVLSYYAPYVSGEVKLDEDAVEYKWAALEELKGLDLIAGIYDEIENGRRAHKNRIIFTKNSSDGGYNMHSQVQGDY